MTARQVSRSTPKLSLLWPVPAVFLSCLFVIGLPEGSAVRLLAAGLTLLFLPGYALTLAAFPGSRTEEKEVQTPLNRRYLESTMASLNPYERIALAVGFGVCLMPVYGYVVSVTGAGYEPLTVIVLVTAATTLFTALAAVRYRMSPTDIEPPAPLANLAGTVADGVSAPTSSKRALNAAVVVMLVISAAGLTAALASPPQSPEYTTAVLLTENEEGELVADGYPDRLRVGEAADLVLRVENHESRAVDYEVVVQIQRVSDDGIVTELSTRDRFEQTVDAGSVWEEDHRVASDMSGERVRLAYLIYKDDVPTEPTIDNSYRNLTLWVGADGSDAEESVTGEPVTPSLSAAGADRPDLESRSGGHRTVDVPLAETGAEAL